MPAFDSLQLALRVAETQRDQAVVALGQVMRQQAFATDQLQQLQAYADETEMRWLQAGQAGITPGLMQHHFQFMGRLEHAMALQQSVVQDAQRKVERQRKVLTDAEVRVGTLQKLLQRKHAEVLALQGRREQKAMDEFAANQIRRRNRDLQEMT